MGRTRKLVSELRKEDRIFLLTIRFLTYAANYLLVFLLIALYGNEQYGEYEITWSLISIATLLGRAGVSPVIARETNFNLNLGRKDLNQPVLKRSFQAICLDTLISVSIFLVVFFLFLPRDAYFMIVFFSCLVITGLLNFCLFTIRAFHFFRAFVFWEFVFFLSQIIYLGLIMEPELLGNDGMTLIFLGYCTTAGFCLFVLIKNRKKIFSFEKERNVKGKEEYTKKPEDLSLRWFYLAAYPFIISDVGSILLERINRFFLLASSGYMSVATFSILMYISRLLLIIHFPILATFQPRLAKLEKEGEIKSKELFTNTLKYSVIFGLALMAGLLVFVRLIAQFFDITMGLEEMGAFTVLLISNFLFAISYLYLSISTIKNDKIGLLFVFLISFLVQLLFNTLLIPSWGILGAAFSHLLSFGTMFILSVIRAGKYLKYKFEV